MTEFLELHLVAYATHPAYDRRVGHPSQFSALLTPIYSRLCTVRPSLAGKLPALHKP